MISEYHYLTFFGIAESSCVVLAERHGTVDILVEQGGITREEGDTLLRPVLIASSRAIREGRSG